MPKLNFLEKSLDKKKLFRKKFYQKEKQLN